MKRIHIRLLPLVLALLAAPAMAGEALDRLHAFMQGLETLSAEFVQTRYDADQNPVERREGVFYLKRPDRFRWVYREPYRQVIVSDGEYLWVYDPALKQVTVRKAERALAAAPIALLSGDKPLKSQFKLRELGKRQGLYWVELRPKNKKADYGRIYLGFSEKGLRVMELRDRFGQATQILFKDLRMNPDLDPSRFDFTPPEGVDVIGRRVLEFGGGG